MKFLMYTKSTCPWCDKAFDLLQSLNTRITLRSVEVPEYKQSVYDICDKRNKPRTVPQIFHGDHYVGGYEDLVVYLKALEVTR